MMMMEISTLVGIAITVAGFFNGVHQYRRKIHLEIFNSYALKYSQIIGAESYHHWHSALEGNRELWPAFEPTMIKYLNLVWEEYYLAKEGIIPKRLWRIWKREINKTIESDFAKETMKKFHFHFPDDLGF